MHNKRIDSDFQRWVDGGWPMNKYYINSLKSAYGAGFYAALRFVDESKTSPDPKDMKLPFNCPPVCSDCGQCHDPEKNCIV
jgi:hypothetical protein